MATAIMDQALAVASEVIMEVTAPAVVMEVTAPAVAMEVTALAVVMEVTALEDPVLAVATMITDPADSETASLPDTAAGTLQLLKLNFKAMKETKILISAFSYSLADPVVATALVAVMEEV